MIKKSEFLSGLPQDMFFGPMFDEEEVEAVSAVIRSRKVTQLSSSVVGEFEEAFADYVGAKEAIAVNSGTASLHTLLAACDIGAGDEVIVPAFTFIGTVGPVLQQRAPPIFADIDPDSYCMTAEDAARKITPRTRAIMPVDIFGHPADLDPIRELADERGVLSIEDACQAHGAKYKGVRVGGLVHATCYSFQESKNMTTAEGGMITTNDPERPLNKLFVEKDKDDTMISRIVAMAREKDIPIQYFDKNKLDALSQSRIHQGVILEVAAKEYVEVEDILDQAEEKGEKPFVLVLDEITDTNNLGSMIRSAECAGVHGIIIPKRRSATLNTTVAKVAAGAMEYVPVARVSNLVQTLRQLKEKGLWIIGADMEGQNNYYDADLTGPCALVIGNEGEGLGRLVKDECDLMVRIPMKGRISSLNAGVAAALVMFEIAKQRG